MERNPLEVLKEKDGALFDIMESAGKFAFAEGALPGKYKLLIALALDASLGADNGVKALAAQAIKAGATKQEVLEAVRVAYHICGASAVYPAIQALNEIV